MEKLSEKEWDEFVLDDIFTTGAGKRLETRNKVEGMRPFIGATDNGNGVTGFVGNDNASKDSNVLGVNYDGTPCIAFYHPYECIFTDSVKRLHLKNQEDNKFVLLFFTSIFAMQRVKYSYGYKFKEKRMHRQKLMLPVDDKGRPDYAYMTLYSTEMRGGGCSCGIRTSSLGSSPSWNTKTFQLLMRRNGGIFSSPMFFRIYNGESA